MKNLETLGKPGELAGMGVTLLQWRQIKPTYPENHFRALNKSLEKLSYEVASDASDWGDE